MENQQKTGFILLSVVTFTLGFYIGCLFTGYINANDGIPKTSYCREIKIDTLQYDYQQVMYKFEVKVIK